MLIMIAFFLSILLHLSPAIIAATPPYNPTDNILLDCGSKENSTVVPGSRQWLGDVSFRNYLPSNADIISKASPASIQDSSLTQKIPYMTARIFESNFTYTFSQLSIGPKFIRLYFYPSIYSSNLTKEDSYFSVFANNYTLLTNFSAFLAVSSMGMGSSSVSTLKKEYIVQINQEKQLNLTFSPSPNSYAFVNGIEIVSMPDRLYYPGDNVQMKLVPRTINAFDIDNTTAYENVYRLNVGGTSVPESNDTGMFRAWDDDTHYLYGGVTSYTGKSVMGPVNYALSGAPAYTAPEIVYDTARYMVYNYSRNYNMTWIFDVDSGFYYLVRLHFCVFFPTVQNEHEMVFMIFINNQTAETKADVIAWGNGGFNVAVKQDYVVYVADNNEKSKPEIWLALHPNVDASTSYDNAFLNGLEIFKLSKSNGSLAGPNPLPVSSPTVPEPAPPEGKKKGRSSPSFAAVGGGVIGGVVLLVCLVSFLVFRQRKRVKDSAASSNSSNNTKSLWIPLSRRSTSRKTSGSGSGSGSGLPLNLCRQFSLEEIKTATGNFDDNFVIGIGGFGNVYKGYIDDGATEVAIKRLNPSSNQGEREFLTEIEMLSKLRHLHLVSLIGYCNDNGEMILVYDYMTRGTLRDHLYKTENPPLAWKQRLQICIGAAKGLHYLHTSAKQRIIHRDVKSTNILLDEKWVAKVSDFGLSKMGPIDGAHTHVSTAVKGSFGYMDPEYYKRQQLTEKSDVYSFGVVLLEVLCARPAIIKGLPREQVSLADWARYCNRKGTFHQIIDPNLKDEIATESLQRYVETAFSCLRDKGAERPGMNDVFWGLEFALKLQETAENKGLMTESSDYNNATSPLFMLIGRQGTTSTTTTTTTTMTKSDDDIFSRSGEVASSNFRSSGSFTTSDEGFKSGNVFSEIMNPSAR